MPIFIEQLSVHTDHKPPRVILEPISSTLEDRTLTLLVGKTGSGKSTLLRALTGLQPLSSGTIHYDGKPLWHRGKVSKEVLLQSSMAFQFPEQQLFAQTVQGEFDYSLRPYRLTKEEKQQRVEAALHDMQLSPQLLEQSPFTLSGGQKRRVALATMAATRRPWLFLDEPSACLDAAASAGLLEQLRQWKQTAGIVMATHDWEAYLPVADRVLILAGGRLVADVTPQELEARPELLEQAGVGLPASAMLARQLRAAGMDVPVRMVSPETMAEWIVQSQGQEAASRMIDEAAVAAEAGQELESWQTQADALDGERGGLVYRLDARAKWLIYTLLSAGFLLQKGGVGTSLTLLLAMVAIGLMQRPHAIKAVRLCKPLLFFMLFAAAFAGLRFDTENTSFPLGFDLPGAWGSFYSLLPFFGITLLGMVFSLTTSSAEMKQGLQKGLSFLERLRIPTSMLALAASLVLRFIPLILEETQRFVLIARARGKQVSRGGKLIPLLISLFQTVEDLITAMEIKGYTHRRGLSPADLSENRRSENMTALSVGGCIFLLLLGVRLWNM
jgi:energy-coupling factor transport system permease/ATP-binding protein